MRVQYEVLCYFQGLKDQRHHEALFSLLPLKSSYTISDIKVCSSSLWQLLRRSGKGPQDAAGKPIPLAEFIKDHDLRHKCWAEVLYLDKVTALKTADWHFNQELTTDEYAVSFCFKKSSASAASLTRPAETGTPHTSLSAPAQGAAPHTTHHVPATSPPQAAAGHEEPSMQSPHSSSAAQLHICFYGIDLDAALMSMVHLN